MRIKRFIIFLAVVCSQYPTIAQNMELYWIPGLTLGYPSLRTSGEPLLTKKLWGVWFQYGHWGARFYPSKKENHSLELDAFWFHTTPYGMEVGFNPNGKEFGGGYLSTLSYADFTGFGTGYNYNIYLPKRIQFSPGIKINFIFRNTAPSGIGGKYMYHDKENDTYEPRSFTMLGAVTSPFKVSISFPIRFTWYTKKNFFLRWGVQYYLGFSKGSYIEFTNYDAGGNIIGKVTAINRNRSLAVELGIGYKFDWKKLKRDGKTVRHKTVRQ